MADKLWGDICANRMFACATLTSGDETPAESTPATTVDQRNPDRAISKDRRIISAIRRIKPSFPTSQYLPVHVPTSEGIARLAIILNAKYIECQVVLTKREVSSAPRFLRLHPALRLRMAAELPDRSIGFPACDSALLYLAMLFGWNAPPAHFSASVGTITAARNAHGLSGTGSEIDTPSAHRLCVGDGIFADFNMRNRTQLTATIWELRTEDLIAPQPPNLGKLGDEGILAL